MTTVALLATLAFAEDAVDPMIEAELGKGVVAHGNEDFSFQIRGRAQTRFTFEQPGAEDADPETYFQVRRLRLVFLAKVPAQDIQLYIQLGVAPPDMESDLLVPLRDAVVTWSPLRDFGLKIGQQKVPFNRERVISSSALQFVDRSIVNAELTLDRDMGVQAFSNDLFGLGDHLAYQVGIFNGDGRNRFVGDTGLLYVARLEVRPFGKFDDSYVQADVERAPEPRMAIGLGVARNTDSVRERSTHSGTFEYAAFTYDHAEADVLFKASGFSVLGEAIYRRADRGEVTTSIEGGSLTETSRSAWGWSAAGGYVFPNGMEPSVRVAQVHPLEDIATDIVSDQEIRAAFSWYFHGHDLKWQTDYGLLGGDAHPDGDHEIRTQLQVYF